MVRERRRKPRLRGRPPLPPEEGKRYPLSLRTTKRLRERLESASRASGRSIAQEIEFRLEQSFEGLEAIFGGREKLEFCKCLAAAAGMVESRMGGKSALSDPDAFIAFDIAVRWLLHLVAPKGADRFSDELRALPDLPPMPTAPGASATPKERENFAKELEAEAKLLQERRNELDRIGGQAEAHFAPLRRLGIEAARSLFPRPSPHKE